MLSFGIYWKQLIAFSLVAAVIGGGVWFVQSRQTSEAAPKREAIPNTQVANLQIALQDGGSAVINGTVFPGLIRFESKRDIFSYQAYERDGSFVSQLITTVSLPSAVPASQLIARHTGSSGVIASEPSIAGSTVTYTAQNLSPNSTYRIELVMPKGVVQPSLLGQLVNGFRNLHPGWWLAVALGMPLLALVVLTLMFQQALRTWRGPTISDERDTVPSNVSPALVAILVTGKVSPRTLASTLLHLAQRGFVHVVHHSDGFTFGKKKPIDLTAARSGEPVENLTRFELILLEKIFTQESIKSTGDDIQLRIGGHIFSRKIAQAYLEMYDAAVKQGWFVSNPQSVYRRFRSLSLIVIALAVIGFILSLIFGPDPYYYLLGWAGLFFVGLVMHQITPFLPRRTKQGDAEYAEWVKFRNYLASTRPMRNVSEAQTLYEQYLPYAVALGVEVEWTERFLNSPFHTPDWYTSEREIHVIEDFANSLFPIVGSVASDMAKAREPYAL